MHANVILIERFYQAFQRHDPADMAACYHPDIHFSDPAFPNLHGSETMAMWSMLLARGGKALQISYRHRDVAADDAQGEAVWEAKYPFSKTGRSVHNIIQAQFRFRDGLIVEHRDDFSFPRWSRQALGLPGLLLGHTQYLRRKVQAEAAKGLAAWQAQNR